MRRALALALEQGQGRDAAVLHNNLALASWQYEGPQAALDACREGIDFCERRGITEFALLMRSANVSLWADLGGSEQTLVEAAATADALEATGSIAFTVARSVQLRLLTERGNPREAPDPEPMLAAARDTGQPQRIARAVGGAAPLLLAQNQPGEAHALLHELDRLAGARADPVYVSLLPSLMRVALALGDPPLAQRLRTGVEPVTPLHTHVLAAAQAQLAEAARDDTAGAAMYQQAAERWQQFGNVPERGYALLGRGRCLTALDEPEAEGSLREAKELFSSIGYTRALAEIEALLAESEAATL